ncbi:MAG: peptidoglycan DD-metalloendopeptidase family protein [Patescibacteria group bacterium]
MRSVGALLVLLVLVMSPFLASSAEAQSRSYRDWQSYVRNSSEGDANDSEQEAVTTRRGTSSSVQRKINDLDNDSVEEIPIPILLGVSLKQIYSDFGDPRGGGTREHEGQDILAPRGAYIVSPTEAVVLRTGNGESSGKYVYTANPGDETFIYMHLDDIADDIKAGVVLKKGDLIGYVGDTGNAKGGVTHLHFEIREGRKATDPYPRLEGEFTLKERMAALTEILKDSDDEEDEAEALVKMYRGLFVAAVAQGIDIPEAIEDALGTVGAVATGFLRDLTLGSQGDDVIALQAFLIAEDKGAKADALSAAGATGYFGPMTQAALIEYQTAVGISPASGYFGPLTRARIAAGAK